MRSVFPLGVQAGEVSDLERRVLVGVRGAIDGRKAAPSNVQALRARIKRQSSRGVLGIGKIEK